MFLEFVVARSAGATTLIRITAGTECDDGNNDGVTTVVVVTASVEIDAAIMTLYQRAW